MTMAFGIGARTSVRELTKSNITEALGGMQRDPFVAQTSESAVSPISQSAGRELCKARQKRPALQVRNLRYSRFGNLRYDFQIWR
jgi:hypothetical protein